MIRFESVTKTYPDGTVAVDGLDLEAPTGKLTILVGPSTALRLLRTLESRESIRRDVDGRFTPGARLVQLGTLALANESLVSLAGGTMRRMVETSRLSRAPTRFGTPAGLDVRSRWKEVRQAPC